MNHHSRSYSEQPQIASSAVVASFNNGAIQPQSFVLEHSNSKQSLDELFNPPQIRSALPWRNRNLPSSFFNPSVKADGESNGGGGGGGGTNGTTNNNLHNRSVSFDQRSNPSILHGAPGQRPNFHMRTHSTLAPMPRLDSNQSSHQSSHEFLNQNQNASNTNGSTTNVSSCPQHSENIVSSTSTNNHNNNNHHHHHDHDHDHHHHQQQQHHHQIHQQPQQLHHHTHSNGWSSAGNSMDDLSLPGWPSGGQSQAHSHQHQVPVAPQAHVHAEHAIHIEPQQQQQQQQQASFVARSHQHHHQQAQHAFVYSGASNDVAAQNAPADSSMTPMRVQPTSTNHLCPNHSLHGRSMSYQQRPAPEIRSNPGFHMRTHSTVAPISTCQHHQPQLATVHHHSSSSQEFLNHSSATNTSATTGWSSSGYSTDDMTSTVSNGGWAPGHVHSRPHQHQGSHPQLHITQQPLPQPPTMDHNPIVPASVNASTTLPHHTHHHNHIPMQAPHQTAHQVPQQLFYNV